MDTIRIGIIFALIPKDFKFLERFFKSMQNRIPLKRIPPHGSFGPEFKPIIHHHTLTSFIADKPINSFA
jgi:hypothetical protein